MHRHPQERQEAEHTTATDENLLAAFNEIELLRTQIKFWRNLAESLNLELHDKEQELQERERVGIYKQ